MEDITYDYIYIRLSPSQSHIWLTYRSSQVTYGTDEEFDSTREDYRSMYFEVETALHTAHTILNFFPDQYPYGIRVAEIFDIDEHVQQSSRLPLHQ